MQKRGKNKMPNKHFCQGPNCHTYPTTDRFLKSKGIIRGRYAYAKIDDTENRYGWRFPDSDKYFCSQGCKNEWLNVNMENIEQGRPIEFIRHRRVTEGYEKKTTTHEGWNGGTYKTNSINRVDNSNG
jgi:hypothetical protein